MRFPFDLEQALSGNRTNAELCMDWRFSSIYERLDSGRGLMNGSDLGAEIKRAWVQLTGERIGQPIVPASNLVVHCVGGGAVHILRGCAVGGGQANGFAEVGTVH